MSIITRELSVSKRFRILRSDRELSGGNHVSEIGDLRLKEESFREFQRDSGPS